MKTDIEFTGKRRAEQPGLRKELSILPGPVYYSSSLGEYKIFAITAEGCPSQKENTASLWALKDDSLEKILEFNKDIWHPTYFMFGTIHFNYHNKTKNSDLFCYFNSLENIDNSTIKLSLKDI
mgnify:CR=1 FL=1